MKELFLVSRRLSGCASKRIDIMITNIPIILGSGSPRRRELLSQGGYKYIVIKSMCDEDTEVLAPSEYVMTLAKRKADDVFARITVDRSLLLNDPDAVSTFGPLTSDTPFIVIGADTVVSLNGRILGKPHDHNDAYNTLSSLSGQTHNVYTGVSIAYFDGHSGHSRTFYESTQVTFYPMTPEEISWYISTGDVDDKAGSYGIQTQGGLFIKKIEGDYNNVVGLPLSRLYHELNALIN